MCYSKLGYVTCFGHVCFHWVLHWIFSLWPYYIIAVYILFYHLCSIPPVSYSYLIIPCIPLLNITCFVSTCSCMLVPTTQFSMHVYDSDLSIQVCLSLHATWHSSYHLLGNSDSPGSSCPGIGAWSLWILPVGNQSSAVVVWIIDKPSEALSFRTPCSSLEFSFCKLVSTLCIVHTCISSCILAITPIGDVIFL